MELLNKKITELCNKKEFKSELDEIVTLAQINILKELQCEILRDDILKLQLEQVGIAL